MSSDESERAAMAARLGDASLDELVAVLWDERALLRRLQFQLVSVSLIVRSGDWQWAADLDRDLLATSERLKRTEVVRAAASLRLAGVIGANDDAGLAALAGGVDEPWRSILLDHDHALRDLTVAVDDAAIAAERWLTAAEGWDYADLQKRFPLLPDGPDSAGPADGR